MKFHENLIRLRKQYGLSQEELGIKLNVTRQTVSKWELGETTPEMDKLIKLSEIFEISLDEIVGKETPDSGEISKGTSEKKEKRRLHYEYKSKREVKGLPLVHVNIGLGLYKAKGIFAIGNLAAGIVSLGLLSMGVFSLGMLTLGVLAVGVLSAGILSFGAIAAGLLAFGGIAVGGVAFGGLAVGYFATGGMAVGVYSVGGCAIAERIAMGGYARGHIAIGDETMGDFCWDKISTRPASVWTEIKDTILREYPRIPKVIWKVFTVGK